MLLFKSFKDDGDELNVAVPDEIRNLVCRVAPVPPANTSRLLCLHVVLQLSVGGMNLLQKLRPTASRNAVLNSHTTVLSTVSVTNNTSWLAGRDWVQERTVTAFLLRSEEQTCSTAMPATSRTSAMCMLQ